MKRIITLLLSLLLLCAAFSFQVSAVSKEAASPLITDDGSADWMIVDDPSGAYAVRYYVLEDSLVQPLLTPTVLSEGNRSLTTSSYLGLATKPNNGGLFDDKEMIELWNGGDELGNGAVTFKVGTTMIAVEANKGAQVQVKKKTSYAISAKANWYNGSYFLKITSWHF